MDHGACALNYMPVTGIAKSNGMVCGVSCRDEETGATYRLSGRVVINAAGIFADEIRLMDEPDAARAVQPSQGVHLVFDREFLQGSSAIMVPHTDDGRVLFVIPWHGKVLVGTTDTAMEKPELEPRALEEEIGFILRNAARYLARDPNREDILSVFAGQRPLVRQPGKEGSATKAISRNHEILVSNSGLLTIVGGKWTTYRKMAEDTLNHASLIAVSTSSRALRRIFPFMAGAAATPTLFPNIWPSMAQTPPGLRNWQPKIPLWRNPCIPA